LFPFARPCSLVPFASERVLRYVSRYFPCLRLCSLLSSRICLPLGFCQTRALGFSLPHRLLSLALVLVDMLSLGNVDTRASAFSPWMVKLRSLGAARLSPFVSLAFDPLKLVHECPGTLRGCDHCPLRLGDDIIALNPPPDSARIRVLLSPRRLTRHQNCVCLLHDTIALFLPYFQRKTTTPRRPCRLGFVDLLNSR